nr:putative ripening-related protein 7 [Aegilops tauschii subsp. strangulata]
MTGTTKVAVVFAIVLVFLQATCSVSGRPTVREGKFELRQNVPATMTVNGFQQGEPGGGPASCDGQFHSDDDFVVSLSSEWYADGARCGKLIRIADDANLHISARVVDECAGCDNEVGASIHIWKNFNLDPVSASVGTLCPAVFGAE